jgi:hypothetical protein
MAKDASGVGQRWTETEARAALADLARSGQSELAFARGRGFSRQRVRYWKSRLGVSTSKPKTAVSPKPGFVAVAMPVVARAPTKIEIHVGELSVRVREDLDVEHLARIVGALMRVAGC